MRKAFELQKRFDCPSVLEVELNHKCRDEIIPILESLKHIYNQPSLRDKILIGSHRMSMGNPVVNMAAPVWITGKS